MAKGYGDFMSIGKEMSIENAIKDVITQKLEEGIIERLVAENLEKVSMKH